LPTLTFDSELNVDLGNRVVEIRHDGVGDTRGDAWAYLPKEQILVTGDLLVAPVPYFFAGYPESLARRLHGLLELDVKAIVPGHGDVMRDETYMRAVLDMVETIVGQVNAAVVRIGSLSARLEDVRPQIDVAEYRRRFAGDDPHNQEYFDESIEGLIKDAFYQAPKWRRPDELRAPVAQSPDPAARCISSARLQSDPRTRSRAPTCHPRSPRERPAPS